MERKDNILYYFPVQADILYKNADNIKSEQFKMAKKNISVPLTNIIISGCGIEDDNIKKYHIIYRTLLKTTLLFSAFFFIFIISVVVSDELSGKTEKIFEEISACLMIPAFLTFPFLIITLICLSVFKYKILNYYLEFYKPCCTQYPDNFRERLAKTGLEMFYNCEEIQGFEDDADEKNNLYENCVCIFCKKHMKCSDISQFENYSAVCPECNKIAVIPEDSDDKIDDAFLYALNKYWFGEDI